MNWKKSKNIRINKIEFIISYYFKSIINTAFIINRFIYLPEFHIIIYKEYEYKVLFNYIDAYFINKLYKLKLLKRRRIINKVIKINNLIKNEEILRQWDFLYFLSAFNLIKRLIKPKTKGL